MSRRGRRVPEAAPLVGLVLAFSVALFGYLFAPPATLLPMLVVALLLLHGFTAYGIARSPDPVAVFPPDAVLAAGFLTAGVTGGYGVAVAGQPMFALFAALVAVLPPSLYHARYGERLNPLDPDATLGVAVGFAMLVAIVGVVLVGDPAMSVVDAAVVVLGGIDYRDSRGEPLPEIAEFTLVAATLGGSALSVVYFSLVAGRPSVGLLVGTALLVVGTFVAAGKR